MPPKAEHNYEHNEEPSSGDTPVTLNEVVKWGGAIFTVVGTLISLVWFAAILKGEIIALQSESVSLRRDMDNYKEQDAKDIDSLKLRTETTDKNVSDMGGKLDVAVAILERIEKNMDIKAIK